MRKPSERTNISQKDLIEFCDPQKKKCAYLDKQKWYSKEGNTFKETSRPVFVTDEDIKAKWPGRVEPIRIKKSVIVGVVAALILSSAIIAIAFTAKDSRVYFSFSDGDPAISEYGFITRSGRIYSNISSGSKISCEEEIVKVFAQKNVTAVSTVSSETSELGINQTAYQSATVSDLNQTTATLFGNTTITVDSQQYPGYYTWDNQADNTEPYNWVVYNYGGSILKKSNVNGHVSVINLHDTAILDELAMANNFAPQTSGQIGTWLRFDAAQDGWIQYGSNIEFYLDGTGNLAYSNGTGITTYSTLTWLYWLFSFNTTTQRFNLTINSVPTVTDGILYGVMPLTYIRFETNILGTGDWWVDTVDYNWIQSPRPMLANISYVKYTTSMLSYNFTAIYANYRNVYNLTVGITQNMTVSPASNWTELSIYDWYNQRNATRSYAHNNTGNVSISDLCYATLLSRNGSSLVNITYFMISTTTPTVDQFNASVSGYFWRDTTTMEFTHTSTTTSTVEVSQGESYTNVTVTGTIITVVTIIVYNHTIQYNSWQESVIATITTTTTIDLALYTFDITPINVKVATFYGWYALDMHLTSVDFSTPTIDYRIGSGSLIFT